MRTQTIPKPHPGEILLEEFIKPAAITPHRVAKDSGISQPTMNQIVNGKRPISTETALRLATYFGTSCELWVKLQKNYDLRIAERDLLPRIQAEVKPLQLGGARGRIQAPNSTTQAEDFDLEKTEQWLSLNREY